MGGHASRDALDVDLARTELEMLMSGLEFVQNVLDYSRMVDDISSIVQGHFRNTTKLVLLMARSYPCMPLNVQLSFCYSRFLDIHIYNMFTPSQTTYNMYTTLAWKQMNSFCYQPLTSNKYPTYKDMVVPISLHRIDHRCTDSKDKAHHKTFIYKILESRSQDMDRVRRGFTKYSHNRKVKKVLNILPAKKTVRFKASYSVTYDATTKTHNFVNSIVKRCDIEGMLRPVHTSLPSLESVLCPKRPLIRRLTRYELENNN